jgi:hypothetical protein
MDSYSNDFCIKLNLKLDTTGINLDTENLPFHNEFYRPQKYAMKMLRDKSNHFTTNKTYQLLEEDKKKIISQLPQSLLALETPDDIGIMNMILPESDDVVYLPPHIDKVRLTAINFYLETSGGETLYYEYIDGELKEKFKFVANKGEIWLLDVDKPHSVKIQYPYVRKVLTISFKKLKYGEVLNHVCGNI